jgi:hypothetical protein
MNTVKKQRLTGLLLISGAIGVLIPYTLLSIIFEYPDILRQDTAFVLTKFHEGGKRLVWTWFAFAISGLPLLPAFIWLGQMLAHESIWVKVATTFGVIALLAQMVGLLRWVFVVPVLSAIFVNAPDQASRTSAEIAFQVIHQYGGVLLGEHVGQLFTIIWTLLLTAILDKLKFMKRWFTGLGYAASAIYLTAQAELLNTVIPGFPHWDLAGAIGSTLWLLWLIILGVSMAFYQTPAMAKIKSKLGAVFRKKQIT